MKQSCRSLNMFDLGIDLVQARNPHFMTDTITILLRMSICFFEVLFQSSSDDFNHLKAWIGLVTVYIYI